MASFFNQTEEVLKIQLTQHGKSLLGAGLFSPEYYLFYDDTVIYDLGYNNSSEDQNNAQDRILNNSITIDSPSLINNLELVPLGTSRTDNDYAPSWDLNILKGNISYIQESSSYYKNVFTSSQITYQLDIKKSNAVNLQQDNSSNYDLPNGDILRVLDDYILIELTENNMQDENQNFELELITYDDLTTGVNGRIERKLSFLGKQTNIFDNIIYSEDELPNRFSNTNIDRNDTEFYFDVLVDEEIDQLIISAATVKDLQGEIKGTYTTTFEGTSKEDC